jgi:hypothetical protein
MSAMVIALVTAMADGVSRASASEEQRQHGAAAERVPLLPFARMVAFTTGLPNEEPAYVVIEWAPGIVERPYPGTPLWRAVLEQWLAHISAPTSAERPSTTPDDTLVRQAVCVDLERFPSFEAWLHWRDVTRVVPERTHP